MENGIHQHKTKNKTRRAKPSTKPIYPKKSMLRLKTFPALRPVKISWYYYITPPALGPIELHARGDAD